MAINDNLAYQEEPLYEILDGKVLAMSPAAPRHNRIAGNIFLIFGNYLKKKKCVPLGDGTAVYLDEQNRFIPDFMVVCDRSKIQSKWVYGAPDLLVEILSPSAAQAWGLNVEGCTASEPQRILDALSDGKLVVAIMTKGHFTSGGHFIVLRGVQDGQIMVADPASYQRSEKLWDLSIILNEASKRAGAGGPFWIIGL